MQSAPLDADAAFAWGRGLRRAGRSDDALRELRRGVTLPRAATAPIRWEIARTLIQKGDFRGAIAECRVVLQMPGGKQAGHVCAAEAHLLWKRASEALRETEEALRLGPSYDAKLAEGLAHEFEVKDDEAEKSYAEAMALDGSRPEAHLAMGRLWLRMGKADGVRHLRRALELDPTHPEVLLTLAQSVSDETEQWSLAERATRERVGYAPALKLMADMAQKRGKLAEARQHAEAAIRADAHDASLRVIAGRVALAEGKTDEALRHARNGLRILGNSADAKFLLADALAKNGDIDGAIAEYEAASGFDHKNPAILRGAAIACRAAARLSVARAFAAKATRDFPADGASWLLYGDILVDSRDFGRAREVFTKALETRSVSATEVNARMAKLPR